MSKSKGTELDLALITEDEDGVAEATGSGTDDLMNPTNPGWSEYVLSLLQPDEKVGESPTTDGLRRVTERVLGDIVAHETHVLDVPRIENERRATVKVSLAIKLHHNREVITVEGTSDVYWGNTEKPYRNHPTATAETRAEGRALRRALRLTKVLVAEENANVVDHDYDVRDNSGGSLTDTQENFIKHICKKLNLNLRKVIQTHFPKAEKLKAVPYAEFDRLQQLLSEYQRGSVEIPEELTGYDDNWQSSF